MNILTLQLRGCVVIPQTRHSARAARSKARSGIQETVWYQRLLDPGSRPVSRGLAGMTNYDTVYHLMVQTVLYRTERFFLTPSRWSLSLGSARDRSRVGREEGKFFINFLATDPSSTQGFAVSSGPCGLSQTGEDERSF